MSWNYTSLLLYACSGMSCQGVTFIFTLLYVGTNHWEMTQQKAGENCIIRSLIFLFLTKYFSGDQIKGEKN